MHRSQGAVGFTLYYAELRTLFERNPITEVTARRGDYVTAALTILRAFHIAGRPEQSTPLGSFTEWSRWVRDALIWLGEADPCKTMEDMRGADPKLESLNTVLEQWHEVIGDDRVTVREIIDRATRQNQQLYGRAEFVHPEFREALLAIAGDGGAINGRRLGKWIAANQNRIASGRKLVSATLSAGLARWHLVTADQPAGTDTPINEVSDDFPKYTAA